MSEPVKPALTAEEWRDVADPETGNPGLAYELSYLWGRQRIDGAIAILNAALPRDDRRKLTWAHVDAVRNAAKALALTADEAGCDDDAGAFLVENVADILASYLPPEP